MKTPLGLATLVSAILFLLLTTQTSIAQNDPNGCNAVLVPSISIDTSNKVLRLSLLKILDQQSYELIKRSFQGGGNTLIDGVPIGGTANWSDFQNRRNHEFQSENFNMSYDEAESHVRQGVPEYASNNWLKCKQQTALGFHSWAEYYDGQLVIVRFVWHPPAGMTTLNVTNSQLVGGKSVINTVPTGAALPANHTFQPGNSEERYIYNRERGIFILSVNASGFADSVTIPGPSPTARLTFTPDVVHSGEPATLAWVTTDAQSVIISPAVTTNNAASGSVQINKAADFAKEVFTYTLSADGVTSTATLTVVPDIPLEENTSTIQEQGMIACPKGFAIAGLHLGENRLTCRRVVVAGDEDEIRTVVDSNGATQIDSPVGHMHACPEGTYLRGFGGGSNTFLCSWDPRRGRVITALDFDGDNEQPSQAHGMHVCEGSSNPIRVVTAVGAGANVWQCGTISRR